MPQEGNSCIRINIYLIWNRLEQKSVCELSCAVMSDSVTPWTVAQQASLSMRFPRQKYWSGLPFSSPGDLPQMHRTV